MLIALGLLMVVGIMGSISGCATENETADLQASAEVQEDSWNIVATTTMLADLAEVIAGDRAEVTGLMGPGIDPHLYQASAGDVDTMQEADIVVYNGVHLEGKMGDIFASLEEQERTIICIEDGIDEEKLLADEENEDVYDPHIWFDVSIWKQAAEYVALSLSAADPESEVYYMSNLESYLEELEELEQYIHERIAELPEHQRVLVTAHDAFQYFGNAYGFEVKGLQGISTDAEAGTADVSAMAEFITEREIKAIFIESSVPSKTIEALQEAVTARGAEVAIGGELYSDSLGDEASGHDSYIETFRANIDTIIDALK